MNLKDSINKILSKIPAKYRVTRTVSYEIVYIEEFPADNKQVGECRTSDNIKQLVIKKNESTTETMSTIVHEMLHSLDAENDIGLTEKQVYGLEKAIMKFFKLNNLFAIIAKLL